MEKGYLVLETGEVFEGIWVGTKVESIGEVVFNTSMTGYQEIMSDPSYAGQIIVFCYPMIGNYGTNKDDYESKQPALKGIITGEICDVPSHYKSSDTTEEFLSSHKVPGLTGIDTRELVKTIRKNGTVRAKISPTKEVEWANEDTAETFWVEEVSVKEPEVYGEGTKHIVLVDFGYKKSILDALVNNGCKVTVVPFNTTYENIVALNPDGILFSNGPGNPTSLENYLPTVKKLSETFPTLGICLGHQLLALAYGAKTEKLMFGHRGGNHPVKDLITGKVLMTSQNHSYVVSDTTECVDLEIAFSHVNDGSVEGYRHRSLPILSVQFHPEANPGPQDSEYIFQQFINSVKQKSGEMSYAL